MMLLHLNMDGPHEEPDETTLMRHAGPRGNFVAGVFQNDEGDEITVIAGGLREFTFNDVCEYVDNVASLFDGVQFDYPPEEEEEEETD